MPLAGLRVVEVMLGASELGLGLAGAVPGRLLGELGADVTRVVDGSAPVIDAFVSWGEAWNRDKRIVTVAGGDDGAGEVVRLLRDGDVAFVYGPEPAIEERGLGVADVARANPALVYARCRPSRTARGEVDDYGLLVEASAGFCTQLAGHREGPIFVDVRATGSGAAFLLTASALALLVRRASTGAGGWAETSLYDGMLATLGCMIGRSEKAPAPVEGYWASGSTYPNFLYRCADGELLQVWFGGKGMYEKLIQVLGDEPSEQGYYADQVNGGLQERKERWHTFFARKPRATWIEELRAAGVACEPILAPGEALADPHLAAVGLAVSLDRDGHTEIFVGSPIAVTPVAPAGLTDGGAASSGPDGSGTTAEVAADPTGPGHTEVSGPDGSGTTAEVAADPTGPQVAVAAGHDRPRWAPAAGAGLLDGLKVLDLSAFVAGPLGAQVLADLGADVIKVEPPAGEAMRAAAYAVAACQRGKRSLTINLGRPEAKPVVEALIRWADVVLHNFRVGVSERLGVDEATVACLNPRAVYCHASAFGPTGPRARYPGNDALMQAVTGFERAVGGEGNDPLAATWIPLDMSGGWVAACGVLAGLYARATTGAGQQVATSLLGAGMLLQSGSYLRDGELVAGPQLDADQTGYGPGYRIYRAGDDQWFALVIPDAAAWARLRSLPEAALLPEPYVPLRPGPGSGADAATATGDRAPAAAATPDPPAGATGARAADDRAADDRAADDRAARELREADRHLDARHLAEEAERVLEAAFLGAPAAEWVARLRTIGLPVEPIADVSRDAFRQGILDDPVNRELGRATAYDALDWGHFEQIGRLLRVGPDAEPSTPLMLPAIGEHTTEVLLELGFTDAEIAELTAAAVVGGS